MAGALLWGYDATNKVWIPLQVDANGYVKVDMSNINLNDLADVGANGINKTNLSQDFGASAGRLLNIIVAPIAGEIYRMFNTAGTCFNGVIDDTPAAHGGQGLDATHVPYDGDTLEDMFNGYQAYDGSNYWGQIILHNTTRGNSRKIVSVDRTNDVVVTSSSTDDWTDDDVITCESQTTVPGGAHEYFDVDLSAKVPTTVDALILTASFRNNTAADDVSNWLYVHPCEAYDLGKRQYFGATLANESSAHLFVIDVVSQKITIEIYKNGSGDFATIMSVVATIEFADT